jgi:subtilase family serine protease
VVVACVVKSNIFDTEEKPLNFRIATIAAAVLIAAGSLSNAQAAVSAAGQLKVDKSTLVDLGAAPSDSLRPITITLPLNNKDALTAFVASTVNPTSPNFRKFLTPAQFNATYAPTADAVAQVTSFLAANGIAVTSVSSDRMLIKAQATNAQLTSLFGTPIHTYSANGSTFQRNTASVVMPAGLKGLAVAVAGLSSQPLARSNIKYLPAGPEGLSAPMSLASAQPAVATGNPLGYLTTSDVISKYNGTSLSSRMTGAGRTLGIMTFAGFSQSDAYLYWNYVGVNVLPNRITEIGVDGYVGSISDNGADETTLDVEQSGGLAPQAAIRVYEAPNTDQGAIDLYATAIGENMCDSLSVSWGLAEIAQDPSVFATYDQLFLEAAAYGVPIMAAAGDAGAYDINRSTYTYPSFTQILTVDFPASSPLVLAAGGTTLPQVQVHKYGNIVIPSERPWGFDYLRDYIVAHYGQAFYFANYFPEGGGGGVSVQYPLPSYQQGLPGTKVSGIGQSMFGPGIYNPSTNTFSGPIIDFVDVPANYAGRNVPDVALNADPYSGYALVFNNSLYIQGGGTSFVAPQLNGIFTLIGQQAGSRLGQLQPQLYGAYKNLGYGAGSPFRAITTGTNVFYSATNSYNPATGLGVLNIDNLAAQLAPQ